MLLHGSGDGPSEHRGAPQFRALALLSLAALSVVAVLRADAVVFGPETYQRRPCPPVTVTGRFRVDNPSGEYTLHVMNRGVTNATISVNGRTMLGPEDFKDKAERKGEKEKEPKDRDEKKDRDDKKKGKGENSNRGAESRSVPLLERPVTLRAGNNQIAVELRSEPGTSLTVEIRGAGRTADTTPPTISAAADPPANHNSWNKTNATVTFTCSDSDSGIAACPPPVTISTEGANQAVSGTAADNAGNTATASVTLNIEEAKAEPPCTFSVSPTSAASAAEGSSGTVNISASSGCQWSAAASAPWITLSAMLDGYGGQVVADGAKGYWRLDEANGATAHDVTGHGLAGTYNGNYVQGVAGAIAGNPAVSFQDGSGYVFVAADSVQVPDGPSSLEAWVQYTGDDFGTVVSQGVYVLQLWGSQARFRGLGIEGDAFDLDSIRTLNDALWHHLVGVSDPAHQTAQLFVDGVLDATMSVSGIASGSGPVSIGLYAIANIDEVAIYDSALSADQVASHYAQSASAGGGSGQFTYTVAANRSIDARVGAMTVAGTSIPITQAGMACITATPGRVTVGASGDVGTIEVSALGSSCIWTASVDAAWVTIGPTAGTGAGQVRYTVAANPTPLTRRAALTIASQTISIAQTGMPPQRPGFHFAIAAGLQYSLALKDDGTVWSWGVNTHNQLGDWTSPGRALPAEVASPTDVVALAAGDRHALALKNDGTVWAWGAAYRGQLGDGTFTFHTAPVHVAHLDNIVAIAAGSEHSVALRADGTVWTWGRNSVGQLGDGTGSDGAVPVLVSGLSLPAIAVAAAGSRTLVVDSAGALWTWGDGMYAPTQIALGVPVATSASGAFGSFAIEVDGTVWAWGANNHGQLGDGSTTSQSSPERLSTIADVAQIAAGGAHTLALRTDRTMHAWGANDSGQLGDGTPPCAPQDVGCVARQYTATPVAVSGPLSVVAVSANGRSSLAVTSDGQVWTWGDNSAGQLGDGTTSARSTPIPIADANFAWHTGTPLTDPSGIAFSAFVAHAGSTTAGSVLRYTTDGRDPTETDPIFPVSGINITQTTTLKVRAWAPGQPPSNVASATYVLKVATPAMTPGAGTYASAQNVVLSTPTPGATIRYTVDGTDPTEGSALYTAPIAVITGMTLKAMAFKDGWTTSEVSVATYLMNFGVLAAPTVAPAPGLYQYGQPIALSAASFLTIRYTTDGTVPSGAWPIYSGPLTLTGPATLSARAFHPDWTASATSTAAFTVKVAAPTFSPDGGTYASG